MPIGDSDVHTATGMKGPKGKRKAIVLIAVLPAACQLVPHNCSAAGCSSGLFIEFDAPPVAPVRIEAMVIGTSQSLVVECVDLRQCQRGMTFDSFVPEHVRLKVTHGSTSAERQVSPYYLTLKPNGSDCGPTCRLATINFTLPR